MHINEKGQATADKTVLMSDKDFVDTDDTRIYWLSSAGIYIESHGTKVMIDPLLEGFDMPLLVDMPVDPKKVKQLDGVLITHIDNDHFSRMTCKDLKAAGPQFHSTQYVASVMREEGIDGIGHDINEEFEVGCLKFRLTPVEHNWQNSVAKYQYRYGALEDYCGFWIDTPDGSIYLPGDSKLLQCQLELPQPEVILFDFSDNPVHITFEGALKMAQAYPESKLFCIHWGSVDAPTSSAFNGNPDHLREKVLHPQRVIDKAAGEYIVLKEGKVYE